MRLTMCDLCAKKIKDIDIRYIKITKPDNDRVEIPVHAELEVCVMCAEKIHNIIMNTDFNSEV